MPAERPDQPRDLTCEAYPGYEWVATLSGGDFDVIAYITQLLTDAGLDAYSPGGSVLSGMLARREHAARARELIAADPQLQRRYVILEDEAGSHPLWERSRVA